MQKQQRALFPQLVGVFINYSNEQFRKSVGITIDYLWPIFKNAAIFAALPVRDNERDTFNLHPPAIQNHTWAL